MKLKTSGLLTLATIMGFSANANAGAVIDIYAGATMGAGGATLFMNDDNYTDSGQSFGALAGIDIPLFRFEAEYNYLNDSDTKLNIGMLNAYFKMPSTVIKPYLGLGLGTVFGGNAGDFDIDARAAYQGMLGITFDMPVLPVKFDAEARALYAPNLFTTAANAKPDLLHYDLRLKARYVF
ncbi:MAG: outer membrane beta-barrel protein [Rickettsiales bacterium]|jgi:hypothetical protein|nr:outer membrane beta-barrel protein [Rickettsiales bacterium]